MKIHLENPYNYFHSFTLSYEIQIISIHHLRVRSIDMISRQCILAEKEHPLLIINISEANREEIAWSMLSHNSNTFPHD